MLRVGQYLAALQVGFLGHAAYTTPCHPYQPGVRVVSSSEELTNRLLGSFDFGRQFAGSVVECLMLKERRDKKRKKQEAA